MNSFYGSISSRPVRGNNRALNAIQFTQLFHQFITEFFSAVMHENFTRALATDSAVLSRCHDPNMQSKFR